MAPNKYKINETNIFNSQKYHSFRAAQIFVPHLKKYFGRHINSYKSSGYNIININITITGMKSDFIVPFGLCSNLPIIIWLILKRKDKK